MASGKLVQLSSDCASGKKDIKSSCEELKVFNDYFIGADYDAFKIDTGVDGNSLNFTLMYIYNRQNWKASLSQINPQRFNNLAFRLQLAYR